MIRKTIHTGRRFVLAAICLLAAGCSDPANEPVLPDTPPTPGPTPEPPAPRVTLTLAAEAFEAESLEGENELKHFDAVYFREGKTAWKQQTTALGDNGSAELPIERGGVLYVTANTAVNPSNTTDEAAWRLQTVEPSASVMSCVTEVGADKVSGRMRHAAVRLDLHVTDAAVPVRAVKLHGIASKGYLFPQNEVSRPEGTEEITIEKSFDRPVTEKQPGILYLAEQTLANASAEVTVEIAGRTIVLPAKLPASLARNSVCRLEVDGGRRIVKVSVGDWNDGGDIDVGPSFDGPIRIDPHASQLPDGATTDALTTTLTLTHAAQRFTLALDCDNELEFASSNSAAVQVEALHAADGSILRNRFTLTKRLTPPGHATEHATLLFRRKGLSGVYDQDRIDLVLKANTALIDGIITFDAASASCNLDRYVEGLVATLRLPEGRTVSIEVDDTARWLKAEPSAENSRDFRIVAGWRPNDPTADGSRQEATIVIADTDGRNAERYVVSRRNFGLPVVEIDGVWWCKYNLRGNAGSFEDQILVPQDPARDKNLMDYIAAASDEELLKVLGDQYQGGKLQSLPLALDEQTQKLHYAGMTSSASDFGNIDPGLMAPEGYRLPSYDDFRRLSGSNSYNLGSTGSSYTSATGLKLTVTVTARTPVFFGKAFGTTAFYEFRPTGSASEGIVLCGLGHQWNTTPGNIAPLNILFATTGTVGRTWDIDGRIKNGVLAENWFRYQNHNSTKTRTIRCIKADPEYIY